MPDFDIDSALSQFGEKAKSSPTMSTPIDVDGLLSQFETKSDDSGKKVKSIIVHPVAPPISGATQEQSDLINSQPVQQGGVNPRAALPVTSIAESIDEADRSGKALQNEGVTDLETRHPYKAAAKLGVGTLARLTAPFSGIVEGTVGTIGNQILPTPNQDLPRSITGAAITDTPTQIAGPGERGSFVAQSAIPVVPGANAVVRALPKNKALSTLIENIGAENLPEVVKQMKANPRLGPADLSPRVLQDTQHLFTNEGPQIDYLAKTSGDRMASAKETVRAIHGTDVPVDTVQKLKSLADASKKVGNEKINPAVAGAGPVDVTKTVDAINGILKPGVNSVISGESSLPLTNIKKELANIKSHLVNDKEMRTSAVELHSFQSGLRRTAESLLRSPNGSEREMGKALMNVRNDLVNDIDKASNGKYKPALSEYRDEMHITDAFREGYEGVFSNSKKMENRPEWTESWFKGLTDNEKEAAREGVRAAIDTEIGVAKNGALAGESFTRSDFNRAKLETVLGKQEAAERITKLEHERAIANTHNKVVEGSQTAMRSASKEQFALPTKSDVMRSAPAVAAMEASNFFMGGFPGVGTGLLVGAKAGAKLKDAVSLALAKEHNAQYAKYALPTEGPSRDALIQSLEAAIPGPKPSILRRAANSRIARLVGP